MTFSQYRSMVVSAGQSAIEAQFRELLAESPLPLQFFEELNAPETAQQFPPGGTGTIAEDQSLNAHRVDGFGQISPSGSVTEPETNTPQPFDDEKETVNGCHDVRLRRLEAAL
eukprot:219227_1